MSSSAAGRWSGVARRSVWTTWCAGAASGPKRSCRRSAMRWTASCTNWAWRRSRTSLPGSLTCWRPLQQRGGPPRARRSGQRARAGVRLQRHRRSGALRRARLLLPSGPVRRRLRARLLLPSGPVRRRLRGRRLLPSGRRRRRRVSPGRHRCVPVPERARRLVRPVAQVAATTVEHGAPPPSRRRDGAAPACAVPPAGRTPGGRGQGLGGWGRRGQVRSLGGTRSGGGGGGAPGSLRLARW